MDCFQLLVEVQDFTAKPNRTVAPSSDRLNLSDDRTGGLSSDRLNLSDGRPRRLSETKTLKLHKKRAFYRLTILF